MKKLFLAIFLVAVIFAYSNASDAQVLYFCEGVDDDGYPITESDVFRISADGSYLYFLVRLPYAVDCGSISYQIYEAYGDGSESYSNTIYQDVEYDWVWFWKKVTFYDAGYYNVYVYDNCRDYLLTSNTIRIKYRN
jgi:hypothetical protein